MFNGEKVRVFKIPLFEKGCKKNRVPSAILFIE